MYTFTLKTRATYPSLIKICHLQKDGKVVKSGWMLPTIYHLDYSDLVCYPQVAFFWGAHECVR